MFKKSCSSSMQFESKLVNSTCLGLPSGLIYCTCWIMYACNRSLFYNSPGRIDSGTCHSKPWHWNGFLGLQTLDFLMPSATSSDVFGFPILVCFKSPPVLQTDDTIIWCYSHMETLVNSCLNAH